MKNSTEREQLLRQLERSRRNLDRSLHSVGHSLDVSHRLETSLRKNTGWWIGGSVIAGIVIASLASPRSEQSDQSKKDSALRRGATNSLGFLAPLMKEAMVLFLPSLKDLILQFLGTKLQSPNRNTTKSDFED